MKKPQLPGIKSRSPVIKVKIVRRHWEEGSFLKIVQIAYLDLEEMGFKEGDTMELKAIKVNGVEVIE